MKNCKKRVIGEEWWRVVKSWAYSSPRQTPCLSGFARDGWRVFHDSIVYSNLEIKNPWCWSLFSISYCRFYYAVWTANWQIWWQLSVLGKTVNCSGSASLLFYVNSKLARPTYIINKNMIIEWLKNERCWQLKWGRVMDLWHTLFVIWYIENGISYKTSLDIWQIEIIFLLLHS